MEHVRTYSPQATEALRLLGGRIRAARRRRRMTVAELAERVGVSPVTMRRIERGSPTVSAGGMFEAAAVLGVPLFDDDPVRVDLEARRLETELALLPKSVRKPVISDDF